MTVQALCAAGEWQKALRWCLSAGAKSLPMSQARSCLGADAVLLAAVGPEGGWTEAETSLMRDGRFQMVALTRTILRLETAALALAAVVMVEDKKG